MSLTKRKGYGVTLGCDQTGGTTYAVLGAVVSGLDGADAKADEIDTTVLSDHYKTKEGGQVDSGTVTFQIAYDPLDTATTTVLTGLLASGAVAGWQITYPIVASETQQKDAFQGYVAGFKRTIDKSKMIVADVTIGVSGNPGFTGA
jgi:hypothetical protein